MSTARSGLPAEPGAYGPGGRSEWMDANWRAHRRWVTVADRRVNVVELGSGPPLVFVHGLSGSWQNWLEQLPAFARDHRVIAMDLPGFGESEMPAEKISIAGYARWLDALLDELGVGVTAVVGNSMGGFIGAELAIQFPPRVERLVLVSAAGLTVEHQRHDRALAVLRTLDKRLAAYAGWVGTRSDVLMRRRRMRRAVFGIFAHKPESLPAPLLAEQVRGSGKPGFVDALDAITDYPIRDRLSEIGCPTLIVWGTEDRLVPVRDADDFERLIPNSRKVVWPETGHVAMLERPAAFNRLVAAFLAEEPGERVGAASASGAPDAPPERAVGGAAESADRGPADRDGRG